MNMRISISVLVVLLISMLSCEKVEVPGFKADLTGVYAIPIGYAEFSMSSFLNLDSLNSETLIDEEGKIVLKYESDKIVVHGDEVMPSLPFGIPIPITDTFIEVDLPDVNGLTIFNAILNEGNITFSIIHSEPEDLIVKVSSESFFKEDEIFSESFMIPYSGISPVIYTSEPIPLIDFTLNSPDQKIQFSYSVKNNSGEDRSLNTLLFTIDQIDFKRYEGGIPELNIDLPMNQIAIDFFQSWESGELSIANPVVSVNIENTFGAKGVVILEEANVVGQSGQEAMLTSDLMNKHLGINYPALNGKSMSEKTTFVIDASNSNIESVFGLLPINLNYIASGVLNPENDTDIYCLNISDSLAMRAAVEIPLQGFLDNAVVIDTLDFSLDLDAEIGEAELSLVTVNELPIGMSIGIELLDEDGLSQGLLFDKNEHIVDAAPVDENGQTSSSSRLVSKIPLSSDSLDALRSTRFMVIKATFQTFESATKTEVIIRDDQFLITNIGLKFARI